MPLVSPTPWIPARYFDDNGDPLNGGKLFAFLAGTSTPADTYNDPGGTVLNPHPVIMDDAGYANIYLVRAITYKLRLTDANDVQLFEVDQVTLPGSGGAFTAPVLTLNAQAGATQLIAVGAWEAGWRQIGVTARVTAAFGTSNGLQQLAIGDAVQFDRWGYCGITLNADTTSEDFLTGDSPWTPSAPQNLLVTAIGGTFDSVGTIQLTRHYVTLS